MCFCSIFRFTFSTELRCYFWSAIFPLVFVERFLEKKKERIKQYRKMIPVFYILIWWGKFLKIKIVLFFSIFSKAKSPHKVLVNTLETVSVEVCLGLFFGSFLCKSMEWQNLSIGGSYRGYFWMPRRGAKNEPLFALQKHSQQCTPWKPRLVAFQAKWRATP